MSNETIKLEADCAVATYNHHHHHHHHQNPHLQLHHNPITHHQVHHVLTSSPTSASKPSVELKDAPCERLGEDQMKDDEEQENINYNSDFRSPSSSTESVARNRTLMHMATTIDDIKLTSSSTTAQINEASNQHQSFNHPLVITSGDKYTQLESVNPQQIIQRNATQTNQYQTAPSKFSSSSDTSESSEDEIDSDDSEADEDEQVAGENEADDDDYGDEDDNGDEDDEDDDDEEEVEDEDEDDETSQDQDCDDIVDPVGNNYTNHQISGNCNGPATMNGICQSAIGSNNESNSDDDEDDEDDDDDDDVSFDNDQEDATTHDSLPSDLSLNSERMLEVTRKLVRSTERDPDRDLRKQVLLRTAIRRLPHFMESACNHYPDSFDQNFRLHNNTLNESNSTTLECLSPSQYYENHNIYHLESAQPKCYYHSVQPNAIQMSTTSLRMLDLNDDQDSEIVVQAVSDPIDSPTSSATKHPDSHLISYETTENENHHLNQTTTSLEQQQSHEYPTSNMYNTYPHHHHHNQHQHESQMNQIQDLNGMVSDDQRTVMHDFNQYSNVEQHLQGSSGNLITRHNTIDNLYQPLSNDGNGPEAINELKTTTADAAAFQNVHDYSRLVVSPEHNHCYDQVDDGSNTERLNGVEMDSMDHTLAVTSTADTDKPIDNSDVLDLDETTNNHRNDKDDLNNNHDHNYKKNDCHPNHHATTTTVYNDSIDQAKLLEGSSLDECTPVSPTNEFLDETTIGSRLNEDQVSICLEGGSSSSQSSTSSDDSANSSTQSNDSAGDGSGTSILETSLNTTNDYHYKSHDSGVALFSPKSNKRTSSSIGLDDEMEIDHLTSDQTQHMSNCNQVFTGSVANHCKRLRKKEIID